MTAAPANEVGGASEVIAGTGALIANGEASDVPPPGAGLLTVTGADPEAAMSAAVIEAIS